MQSQPAAPKPALRQYPGQGNDMPQKDQMMIQAEAAKMQASPEFQQFQKQQQDMDQYLQNTPQMRQLLDMQKGFSQVNQPNQGQREQMNQLQQQMFSDPTFMGMQKNLQQSGQGFAQQRQQMEFQQYNPQPPNSTQGLGGQQGAGLAALGTQYQPQMQSQPAAPKPAAPAPAAPAPAAAPAWGGAAAAPVQGQAPQVIGALGGAKMYKRGGIVRMAKGGIVKMAKGGKVSAPTVSVASRRGDGIAQRGKTRGKIV